MGDFVTTLVMVVILFAGGTVISAEGQNATENYLQGLFDGTQELSTVGPKNDTSPRCRDICECLSGSIGNNSILPACFRIKGNSSHLVKQMLQDNSEGRTCVAPGDSTMFQCEGGQMTCMYNDGGNKQDTVEDPMSPSLSSVSQSVTDENTYTYVTCDRLSEERSILSCRIDKNSTRSGSCAKESLTKCHYKSAGNMSRDDKCPQGWSFRRKRCHRHVDDPLTFDQAYTRCRQMGAFLTLDSGGLNDEFLPLEWGQLTHWAENKTRDNGTSECFVTNTTHVKTRCEDSHPFFCYKEVFKFLQCKAAPEAVPVVPTEELTTETVPTTLETTSITTPTPTTTTTPTARTTPTTKTTSITTPTTPTTPTARTTPATKTTSITTPTTMATPTARTTPTTKTTSITTPTTMATPTARTTPNAKYQQAPDGTSTPAEKLNIARVALKEAKAEIGNFVAQFTDDQATLDILDDIIDAPPLIDPGETGGNNAAATMVSDMVEKMDSLVDSLADVVSGPGKSLTIENDQLVLKVIPICVTCSSTSPGPRLEAGINNDSYVVQIPSSAMGDGATAAISALSDIEDVMSANMVENGEETTTGSENQTHEIVSMVATVSVKKWDGSDLQLAADQAFEIIFNNKDSASDTENSGRSCCYWQPNEVNTSEGAWSTEGCVTKVNRTHTTCQCTHLTSFAVLMQVSKGGEPQSSHVRKIQDYMTYVGCGLSMTCLATMLIVFTIQKLYRSDRNVIHMNLASSLLVSQAVFLFGIERVEIWQVCKTIGICLHFFLLATFFWMLVEGIYLISKTTSTRNRFLAMPTYIAIGWGGPAIIVGITAGVSFKSYSIDKICWLSNENGGIWAFVGPAIGIVMMNVSLLCQVIRVFLSLKTNMKKAHSDRIWLALRAMLLTLPLLGGTWLFGILSFNSQTIFFSYIFIVLNSLQGVFIFVLYCVMNDEVKKVVERKLSSISGRASNGRSTKSTT